DYAAREMSEAPVWTLSGDGVIGTALPDCDPRERGGDWIDDQERTYRRVVPRDCSVTHDNPPAFWWAPHLGRSSDSNYTLTIRDGAGESAVVLQTPFPYATLAATLPPGDFTWQVSVQTPNRVATSRSRKFRVPANATAVVTPDAQIVLHEIA